MSRSKVGILAVLLATVASAAVFILVLRKTSRPAPVQTGDSGQPGTTGPEPDTARMKDREPGFQDVAAESGITFTMSFLPKEQGEKFKTNLYDHGCGVTVGDYNGDGHDDVYFLNQLGSNALYKNKGDGTFVEVAEEAGVALGDRICAAATFGDYDNDGDQDLFVTSTRGGNVLFQNQGNGRFKDVTTKAGVNSVAHSQTSAFFDFDNDGYLDLFVANTAQWTTETLAADSHYFVGPENLMALAPSPKEYNILYHNNRDGTFTDVAEETGVKGQGWAGDVAVADFDEDGRLDLFVSNMFGRGLLLHNEGDGKFRDVAAEALGRTSWGMAGSKFFDFNNDGHLDLYIVDMHSDMWVSWNESPSAVDEKRKYRSVSGLAVDGHDRRLATTVEKWFADAFQIRYDEVVFGNTLFKNLGGGAFQEVCDYANMETFWPWGIATGDFDNDGYEDAFVPSGMGYPYFYWRNYLMMNGGDGAFGDRSRLLGIEPPAGGAYLEQKIGGKPAARSSRSAATADFDGDGLLEIIVNNFNDHPYYFKNTLPRKNHVAFRLEGTKSNRDAIGAVLKIHLGEEVMVRQVQAAGGYLSQSSKTVHFGLGTRPAIDRVEIVWPSGVHQQIERPQINTLHPITEPEA